MYVNYISVRKTSQWKENPSPQTTLLLQWMSLWPVVSLHIFYRVVIRCSKLPHLFTPLNTYGTGLVVLVCWMGALQEAGQRCKCWRKSQTQTSIYSKIPTEAGWSIFCPLSSLSFTTRCWLEAVGVGAAMSTEALMHSQPSEACDAHVLLQDSQISKRGQRRKQMPVGLVTLVLLAWRQSVQGYADADGKRSSSRRRMFPAQPSYPLFSWSRLGSKQDTLDLITVPRWTMGDLRQVFHSLSWSSMRIWESEGDSTCPA